MNLALQLKNRHFNPKQIAWVLESFSPEYIQDHIEAVDYRRKTTNGIDGFRAVGRYLYCALRDDYSFPRGFVPSRMECPECGGHVDHKGLEGSYCAEKFK